MFRLLLIALCLAVPTFCFATTALPPDFCSYGNFEQHSAPPPQTLPKAAEDYSNSNEEKFQLRLTGGNGGFSGFAIQAQDPSGVPVGRFQIIDEHNSKTMACKHLDDTILHAETQEDSPLKSVDFSWIPAGYQGTVRFVATMAKEGGQWVRRTLKEINV
ncbi:defense protein l(2)34Fc-like [Zeugodacus cucurbitae]|uniref:defense protein l(2)34Fc-like n=1 Tax=Zeugodacus cucurbitae TaxID=28588 RepID=UPI000596A090|nr:defense protein l(2)34Fc-like [Zeugodacus cucurbitae]